MPASRKWIVLDFILIFLLAGSLVRPLFKAKYIDRFESIESTFISDGRFLKDHLPHPNWQPLWYCGTRFDYVYPPALRYGTALLSKIWIPPKAYHIYTAFFYCLGIAGVYLFVRLGGRSRAAAWLAALATATVSPSFLLLERIRNDAVHLAPQRLAVLVRYGEGPHMTALALIPFALICAFYGLRKGRPAALAGAAVFSAALVANNFYGATALAMFFPILVWSVWVAYQDRMVWVRAAAIALLAYGLTAFWLTPSYIRITAVNMQYVSNRGHVWSMAVAAVAAALFAYASYRWARGKPDRAYTVFVAGALLAFGINVLGLFYFDFRVWGEPGRLVPELDLVLTLAVALGLEWLLRRNRLVWRLAAAAVVLASAWSARTYLANARTFYPITHDYRQRIEYQITEWMARNMPDARAAATGSVRFWYNAWFDLAQLGGGSEQGLLNGMSITAQWQLTVGEQAEPAIHWMQAMGVDAIIVHEKHSREIYHDFQYPRKFAGVLRVAYDNGAGDIVYRVPRRFPGLARVVETRRMTAFPPMPAAGDLDQLRAYVEVVEKGPDAPVSTAWQGTDQLCVRARVGEGQSVLAQVSYDPSWHAYSAGRRLPIRKDPVGFMLIDAPPGDHDLTLRFELPFENLVGRILTAIALLVVGALMARGFKKA